MNLPGIGKQALARGFGSRDGEQSAGVR